MTCLKSPTYRCWIDVKMATPQGSPVLGTACAHAGPLSFTEKTTLTGGSAVTIVAIGALLFGFLNASSGILQITGNATPEVVEIMKGIIVLSAVVAYEVVRRIKERDETQAAAEATERMATAPATAGSHA